MAHQYHKRVSCDHKDHEEDKFFFFYESCPPLSLAIFPMFHKLGKSHAWKPTFFTIVFITTDTFVRGGAMAPNNFFILF